MAKLADFVEFFSFSHSALPGNAPKSSPPNLDTTQTANGGLAGSRAIGRQHASGDTDSLGYGHFHAAIISELQSAKRHAAQLAAGTALYALGHAATALCAGLLGRTLVRQGGEVLVTPPERVALYSILFLGLLATAVKSFSGALLGFYESRFAGSVGRRLRGRTVAALLGAGSHDAPPRVLATIAVRIREVEVAAAAGALSVVRSVAQLVPLAATLIWLSPLMAAAGVLVLAPFAVLVARLRSRWRAAHAESAALVEGLHRGVDDLVRNIDLWRTYGAGSRIAEAIDETSVRATRAAARVDAARASLSGANEVLGALALLGGVTLALELGLPIGDGTLVAFAAVFFMAYRPLRDLGDGHAWCVRGVVAAEALAALTGNETGAQAPSPGCDPSAARAVATANSIVHRDGDVAPRRLTLSGLGSRDRGPTTSLVLEPGELVTVVGPSGSGKTTLLRALLGLEPSVGGLRWGDQDLTLATVGPVARPFAWVPQDAPLVTDTVLRNVALHAPDDAAAMAALEQIGASALQELREVVVGPGGRSLSGGEQRQLAIARALASGQPVLLLDEPIAGLDRDAAARVLEALTRLRGRRSLLVVTHRPEVIAIADRVVNLGEVAA